MKFLVSSPEKPENSPLYSVHTDLDSFILYNDPSLGEPTSENRNTNNNIEPMDFNIMATLEEYDEENHGQGTENETLSEQETKRIQPSNQIPTKCMVMDVVVADVPPKYGMLLSRSWGAKL